MFVSLAVYYLFMKAHFFFSLVRIQVKFDTMRDHWLSLEILCTGGVVYTGGVAFLSYVFLVSWQDFPWPSWQIRGPQNLGVSPWQAWLGETLVATRCTSG
jgi:hypothetical protein